MRRHPTSRGNTWPPRFFATLRHTEKKIMSINFYIFFCPTIYNFYIFHCEKNAGTEIDQSDGHQPVRLTWHSGITSLFPESIKKLLSPRLFVHLAIYTIMLLFSWYARFKWRWAPPRTLHLTMWRLWLRLGLSTPDFTTSLPDHPNKTRPCTDICLMTWAAISPLTTIRKLCQRAIWKLIWQLLYTFRWNTLAEI